MIITHKVKKEKISKNIFNTVERTLSLFMLSRRGHYFSIPAVPSDHLTNLNGWFNILEKNGINNSYSMYKSIDNIYINKTVTEIVNNFTNVERVSSDTVERFTLAKNGLIYEVNSYSEYVYLDLDFREMFDTRDTGRIYNVYKHDDLIIVEYTKFTDDRLVDVERKAYLVIKGASDYELINKWSQRFYHYDFNRKDGANFFIYNALKIPCRKDLKLYLAFSESLDVAIQKVDDIFTNSEKIDAVYAHYIDNVLSAKNAVQEISGVEAAFAYTSSVHAIDNLSMQLAINNKRITGMWAGLPWFYQYWSRDELVSVMSLMLEHRYDYSKELLMKYLFEIMTDGRLSNRYPAANLGTADSIGWLFKRLQDFLFLCERRNNFNNYFTLYDLNYISERLKFSIKMLLKNHSKDGLIYNDKQETWIDTYNSESNDKDYREGARIEDPGIILEHVEAHEYARQLSGK